MANEVIIELIARTEAAQGKIDALEKELQGVKTQAKQTNDATKGLTSQLDKMTGGAVTAFRGIVSGAKSGVMAMTTLKGAIAATGIGALVIAVGTLATAFSRTQKGAEAFDRISSTIGATLDVVLDRIATLGLAVIALFDRDFEEAARLAKEAFSNITEEITKETEVARELADAQNELEKAEAELILTSAKRRAAIEDYRLQAEDQTKTEKERADAIREAMRLEEEEADAQIEIAKERARIIEEENAQGYSRTEAIRRQREAEAQLFDVQRRKDKRMKELTTRLNSLTKAEQKQTEVVKEEVKANEDLIKAEQARIDRKASQIEQITALENEYFDSQLDRQTREENAVREKYFALIEAAKEYGLDTSTLEAAQQAELDRVREDAAKRQEQRDKEEKKKREEKANEEIKREEEVQAAKVAIAQTGLNVIGQIFGQESAAGKAAAVASATIDTYKAFNNALANTPLPPPGPQIAAGLTLAQGFAQVRNILSTQIPNNFGGGGGAGGAGAATPSLPNVSILGGNEAMTQATRSISELGKKPTRAFVVSGDVTNNQALDRRIERNASFG